MLRRSSKTVPAGDQVPNPLLFRIGEFAKAALSCILANGQTMRWATQKRVLKTMIAQTAPCGLAIDVGCGGGTYAIEILARKATRVVALDISWRHAWITRERARRQALNDVSVLVASADALPFRDGVADLVLCSEVLEHVSDDAQALREFARVSKAGCGKLLLTVPHPPEPVHNPAHVLPGYTESGIRALLERAGFTVRLVRFCMFGATRAVTRWCAALRLPLPLLFICQIEQYLADRGFSFGDPIDMLVLAERENPLTRNYSREAQIAVGHHLCNTVSRAASMRIAIFDYAVIPTNPVGGYHFRLLRGLCHEHEFTVFAVRLENPCPERIRWVRVPALTRPGALLFVAFHLLAPFCYWWHRLRHGVRFDLVQFVGSELSFGDISSTHFCNRAYLKHHWRQSRPYGMRRLAHWLVYRLHAQLEPWVYRHVQHIVVPSQGLARELRAEYPFAADKIRVVPTSVDVEDMERPRGFDREGLRQRLGITPGDLAVAFVALGGYERKGLPLLMEALARLQGRHLKVIVVGGPRDLVAAYRRRAGRMGLNGEMLFVGMQEDVRPYLWAADGFALPSHYEVFPRVALEAAAAGLPLLVTPLNGIEEFLVGDRNGLLVDLSVEGVCRGLSRLLEMSPEERHAMGQRAREEMSRYTTEHFVWRWRQFYATVPS